MKKSEREESFESPISFHPSSNGEFEPLPVTERNRFAAGLFGRLVADKAKRMGMTRREFAESASGMVAALVVMNQTAACGGSGGATSGTPDGGGGFSRDAGFDVPTDVSAADAAGAAADAQYDVTEDTIEDAGQADQVVSGPEFIFDVQTHNRVPAPPGMPAPAT